MEGVRSRCKKNSPFILSCIGKGLSIKNVRSQEGGSLQSADIFQTKGEGFFRCESPHFWCKNIGFFEIYGVSHGQGGRRVEPVRTLCGQRRSGQFFERPLRGKEKAVTMVAKSGEFTAGETGKGQFL